MVWDDQFNCGIGLFAEESGQGQVWGMVCPRNFIASWRGTEILRHLTVIKNGMLCYAYNAGLRNPHSSDQEKIDAIIGLIGREKYDEIMAMPVPEEIIGAMLERQGNKWKPDLWPITQEVRAGTITWRQEFTDAGIKHPDKEDAEQREREAVIAEFEKLLMSYAAFVGLTRDCFGMSHVDAAVLILVDKGVRGDLSDEEIVALAGVVGHLASGDFASFLLDLPPGKDSAEKSKAKEIEHSAKWLVEMTTPSRFARLFGKRSRFTLESAKQLLTQLLAEHFPPETQEPESEPEQTAQSDRPKLNNEILAPFVGGQLEIQNQVEGYLYRGEIAQATLEGDGDLAVLNVKFAWCAKGDGYPPVPTRWVNEPKLDYTVSTCIVSVSNLGDGRLCLSMHITNELAVLYPPDRERKLDPANVEGLVWPPDNDSSQDESPAPEEQPITKNQSDE